VAAVQLLAGQINGILLYFMYYQVNVTAATAQVSGLSSVLLSYITLSVYVLALIVIMTGHCSCCVSTEL
jgi:hypothetical protein